MVEAFLYGLGLGYGAAVPIGAVNLEITRRNLKFGTRHGIATGLGACSADLVYLLLLSLGVIALLQYEWVLRVIGFVGSAVLLWFAYQAYQSRVNDSDSQLFLARVSHSRNWLDGFLMTMLNPYTILFWASISSQVATNSLGADGVIYAMSCGLVVATTSWVLFLNGILHKTRHKFEASTIRYINVFGAALLTIFAIIGIYRSIEGFQ